MKYFPYEDFHLKTSLTPSQVQERLSAEIEPDIGFSFKKLFNHSSSYYFKGYLLPGVFRLEPLINYRNSFVPVISGQITGDESGSTIYVKMKLKEAVIIFLSIWMGFAGFAGLGTLYAAISNNDFDASLFIAPGMVCFAYLLTLGGFKAESIVAREKMMKLLEAVIA